MKTCACGNVTPRTSGICTNCMQALGEAAKSPIDLMNSLRLAARQWRQKASENDEYDQKHWERMMELDSFVYKKCANHIEVLLAVIENETVEDEGQPTTVEQLIRERNSLQALCNTLQDSDKKRDLRYKEMSNIYKELVETIHGREYDQKKGLRQDGKDAVTMIIAYKGQSEVLKEYLLKVDDYLRRIEARPLTEQDFVMLSELQQLTAAIKGESDEVEADERDSERDDGEPSLLDGSSQVEDGESPQGDND